MLIEILFDTLVYKCTIVMELHISYCNIIVFLLSDKIDNKSNTLFSFLYCNSTVLYMLFHVSQLMTDYPLEHTTVLNQFMNWFDG